MTQDAVPTGTSPMSKLSPELLLMVLDRLGAQDAVAAAGVCRQWRRITTRTSHALGLLHQMGIHNDDAVTVDDQNESVTIKHSSQGGTEMRPWEAVVAIASSLPSRYAKVNRPQAMGVEPAIADQMPGHVRHVSGWLSELHSLARPGLFTLRLRWPRVEHVTVWMEGPDETPAEAEPAEVWPESPSELLAVLRPFAARLTTVHFQPSPLVSAPPAELGDRSLFPTLQTIWVGAEQPVAPALNDLVRRRRGR